MSRLKERKGRKFIAIKTELLAYREDITIKSCIFKTSYVTDIFGGIGTHLRDSLTAQLVKNPPAMQETLVRFLGQKNPLEKG